MFEYFFFFLAKAAFSPLWYFSFLVSVNVRNLYVPLLWLGSRSKEINNCGPCSHEAYSLGVRWPWEQTSTEYVYWVREHITQEWADPLKTAALYTVVSAPRLLWLAGAQVHHLLSSLLHSFCCCCSFLPMSCDCGISVPWPGIELGPWKWKPQILTTGRPGNSQVQHLKYYWCSQCVIKKELLEKEHELVC